MEAPAPFAAAMAYGFLGLLGAIVLACALWGAYEQFTEPPLIDPKEKYQAAAVFSVLAVLWAAGLCLMGLLSVSDLFLAIPPMIALASAIVLAKGIWSGIGQSHMRAIARYELSGTIATLLGLGSVVALILSGGHWMAIAGIAAAALLLAISGWLVHKTERFLKAAQNRPL